MYENISCISSRCYDNRPDNVRPEILLQNDTGQEGYAAEHIPLARKSDPLPAVLSQEEVVRFLKAVPDLRYRTVFATIYAAGLRVSEAVALTIKDIDSARMVICVRQGTKIAT